MGKQICDIPSFLVCLCVQKHSLFWGFRGHDLAVPNPSPPPSAKRRLDSEKHIDFALTSPFGGGRPGRVRRRTAGKWKLNRRAYFVLVLVVLIKRIRYLISGPFLHFIREGYEAPEFPIKKQSVSSGSKLQGLALTGLVLGEWCGSRVLGFLQPDSPQAASTQCQSTRSLMQSPMYQALHDAVRCHPETLNPRSAKP